MPLGSDHFLLRDRPCVKEGLHRRFSETPASLMWPCLIVLADPQIDVDLQLVDRTIHLFSKRDAVELVEHGFVEALADAVGLRALCLGPRMIDVLDGKIKLVLMMLGLPQYSVPRSVNTRLRAMPWSSKNGSTRSFKISAAVIGVLRS